MMGGKGEDVSALLVRHSSNGWGGQTRLLGIGITSSRTDLFLRRTGTALKPTALFQRRPGCDALCKYYIYISFINGIDYLFHGYDNVFPPIKQFEEVKSALGALFYFSMQWISTQLQRWASQKVGWREDNQIHHRPSVAEQSASFSRPHTCPTDCFSNVVVCHSQTYPKRWRFMAE